MVLEVKCPTCNNLISWTPENSYRPFCSERCRLIDLGEWFSEERRIADENESTSEIATLQLSPEDLELLDQD
ncbi:DNA gyrase inhibitor YacG [uncultured Tolumonas sp.]|uniref:DNA gyrase inhibitor YacG n=1 Tax=uncultured Tolumonas sp. TaxID=263765 RepID=UPI0029309361|nr:DNA gyrase inhibitor YacG [uncultured Tolumonas sp.]